jgi:hypothetical protein
VVTPVNIKQFRQGQVSFNGLYNNIGRVNLTGQEDVLRLITIFEVRDAAGR